MNVNTDLSFLTLVAQASLVVQAVLLLLVALSLWSWWQIFLACAIGGFLALLLLLRLLRRR